MSKKRSAKQQKRQKRRSARLRAVAHTDPPARAPENDLMAQLDDAIHADSPFDLLGLVSSLLAAVDRRERSPLAREDEPTLAYDQLLESLLGVDNRQTTAALWVMAALSADELHAVRIRRGVASRHHALPDWIARLPDTEVYRAVEMSHVLGDGDDVLLGVRLAAGHELTALVYIDHNMGTVVKDAFVVDEPVADLVRYMKRKTSDPDTTWDDLSLADARARVEAAIELGAMTYPPFSSDSWPACRPLVEWLARMLPTGGRGYVRPEWSESQCRRLVDDFFTSSYGSALDDDRHRDLLDSIVWFGSDYGPGDPMRWSAVAVEILLLDWVPRKIVAEVGHLAPVPELLRAFIRYCHDRRGIRAALTSETLHAVDAYEAEYQEAIRTPRRQGPMALLEAMGAFDRVDAEGDDTDSPIQDVMLASLRRRVGGEEELAALDTEPLPAGDFDWTAIPDDIRDRVEEVRRLCDDCCEELFDLEHRTACQRLLARAAAGDPEVFRRRGAARTAAAAICWIIGKANHGFGRGVDVQVRDLMAHFGLRGSPSQRAQTMLRAVGLNPYQYGAMDLESADLLVSTCREQIVERRSFWLARRQ